MKETQLKKFSIVMEGGGMRGLYTAGVIDVLMENEIYADSAVGVSAGAVFGCNYKSRQIGRVLRYNKKYCKDIHQWSNLLTLATDQIDQYKRDYTNGNTLCDTVH